MNLEQLFRNWISEKPFSVCYIELTREESRERATVLKEKIIEKVTEIRPLYADIQETAGLQTCSSVESYSSATFFYMRTDYISNVTQLMDWVSQGGELPEIIVK